MATFRKRAGRWQARVQRRGQQEQSQTFKSRPDAEKWARAVERQMDLGAFSGRSKTPDTTVGQLLERYVAEVSPCKRGGPQEVIRLTAMARRAVGRCLVAQLSPKAVARYRDLRLLEVSAVTVNRDLDDLSAVLNHARREWGVDVGQVVSEVRRPPKGRGRTRVLSAEEEARLVAALDSTGRRADGRYAGGTRNPWIKPIVRLAIATAMRRGELLALKWEDVQFDRRVATLSITKNGDSRSVPLSSAALTLLQELPRQTEGRIFPITPMALRKAFERAARHAEITDLHFHDLRHTAATRISKLVPNLIELAAITGHRDVRMLARYYHPDPCALALKLG